MKIFKLFVKEFSNKYSLCILVFFIALFCTHEFHTLMHNLANDQEIIDALSGIIAYCVVSRCYEILNKNKK